MDLDFHDIMSTKCYFVGEPKVGISTLLQSYQKGHFIEEEDLDRDLDIFSAQIVNDTCTHVIDTQVFADDKKCDWQFYVSSTDTFIICFAMNDVSSINNVPKWIEDCKHYYPPAKRILCGLKSDYRFPEKVN